MLLLDLFNAQLSAERYWWGPRYQEVGEEANYIQRYAVII